MALLSVSVRRALVGLMGFAATCGVAAAADDGPQRIVSVGGDVTEIVYALGAGDRVVATDTTSVHPPVANATPKVGYARNLAAEGVLSTNPDLVLLGGIAGPEATIAQLGDAGTPLVRVSGAYTIDAVREKVQTVAEVLDAGAAGEALLAQIDADWRDAEAVLAGFDDRPRGLFFLNVGQGAGPQASGAGTAAAAVMDLIGVENVFASEQGYKALSLEAAVAADPDVIFTMAHQVEAMGGVDAVAAHPALALTAAAQAGRIVVVDPTAALNFGPRTPMALGALAKAARAEGAG